MKIYGERNTGTNFLTNLVKRNLNVELISHDAKGISLSSVQKMLSAGDLDHLELSVRKRIEDGSIHAELLLDINADRRFSVNLGWKHSLVDVDRIEKYVGGEQRRVLFLTMTKNPYSWLLSLFRRPYNHLGKRRKTFEDFLTSQWHTVGRENAPGGFGGPVDMWNIKNRAYVQLNTRFSVVNLRYEDLVVNPGAVIRLIADTFSLRSKLERFSNIDGSTKGDDMNFSDYQAYYLGEEWKRKLTPRHVGIINKALDESVMQYYGYKLIDGTDPVIRS